MSVWSEISNLNDAIRWITGGREDCVQDHQLFREHCSAPEALAIYERHLKGKVKTMLDFGCGIGRLMSHFKKADPSLKITGYDFPNMLQLAEVYLQADFKKYEWVSHPLDNLTLLGKRYDLIFSSLVLQHLSAQEINAIIAFLPSILNPGGHFLHLSRSWLDEGGDVWEKVFKVFKPKDGVEQPEYTDHKIVLCELQTLVEPA